VTEQRIRENNERIEELAGQSYPLVARKQVKGVGTLIALTFLLSDVGCYLGLQPARRNSGESEPTATHQQGRQSVSAHPAGARCPAHSGTVRRRQRSAPLGPEAGRARREEREKASRDRSGTQAAILLHHLWVSGEAYEPLRNRNRALLATAA
jgi:transposase